MERAVRKAMNKEMDAQQKEIDSFTSSWSQGSKPVMTRLVYKLPNGAVGFVFSTDSTPFVWVAGGTRRRHATFPGGYSPKTVPGSLQSLPGGAYHKIVSRSIKKRGIRARNPHVLIAKKRNLRFKALLAEAFAEGLLSFFI